MSFVASDRDESRSARALTARPSPRPRRPPTHRLQCAQAASRVPARSGAWRGGVHDAFGHRSRAVRRRGGGGRGRPARGPGGTAGAAAGAAIRQVHGIRGRDVLGRRLRRGRQGGRQGELKSGRLLQRVHACLQASFALAVARIPVGLLQLSQIWDEVEEYMDERRRDQREKRLREEVERERKENPKITEQFRDLKRQLADVSYEQWDGIPEIGDYTVKKQKRFESFVPGSDALLAKAVAQGQVAAREVRFALYLCDYLRTGALRDALADSAAARSRACRAWRRPRARASTRTSRRLARGRRRCSRSIWTRWATTVGPGRSARVHVMYSQCERSRKQLPYCFALAVEGKTTIDPQGYMTAMAATPLASADIQDIKRARQLFKSVISSNPKNPAGWVGAAVRDVFNLSYCDVDITNTTTAGEQGQPAPHGVTPCGATPCPSSLAAPGGARGQAPGGAQHHHGGRGEVPEQRGRVAGGGSAADPRQRQGGPGEGRGGQSIQRAAVAAGGEAGERDGR